MSDAFYRLVKLVGTPAFLASSAPTILGDHHTRLKGPALLAATHSSPYDIALLIRHSHRPIDFVSITEVFKNPFVAAFYSAMNAFPLDRSRPDPATVRKLLTRTAKGRLVGLFPEGALRPPESSVLNGGQLRPGLGRLALLANCPIIPVVILNSTAYATPTAWLPLRHTNYALAFGPPIPPNPDPTLTESHYLTALLALREDLRKAAPNL